MTDSITQQLRQKIWHYVRRGQRNHVQFDISPNEIAAWLILNDHVESVMQRNGISGLKRIDEREPWSLTNMQFDASTIVKQSRQSNMRAVMEIPANYRVLTKAQWMAEISGITSK